MVQIREEVLNLSFDLRRISELAFSTPGCLRSDLGELNFPIATDIPKAIKSLADIEDFSYAATFGVPTRLTALENFESETLGLFDSPKTLITSGGQAALFAILNTVIHSGDRILTDHIYYPPYNGIAQLTKGQLIARNFHQLDGKDISAIRVLILNSPRNPSGKIYSKETLIELAKLARQHNWLVIEDAVYNRIYFEDHPLSIAAFCPERTLVINSASKNFCLPGMRIGWVLGESELVTNVAKMHRNMNSCPNTFFQKVLASFLPNASPYLMSLRIEMMERRDLMLAIFDQLGWTYEIPQGAIYVFVKVPSLEDSFQFVEKMIREIGVSAMPGMLFGHHPSSLRFCYGAMTKDNIKELGKRLLSKSLSP